MGGLGCPTGLEHVVMLSTSGCISYLLSGLFISLKNKFYFADTCWAATTNTIIVALLSEFSLERETQYGCDCMIVLQ